MVVKAGSGSGSGASGTDPPAGPGSAASVVTLRDVATIRDTFEDRQSIAKYNGEEAVGLLLFKP